MRRMLFFFAAAFLFCAALAACGQTEELQRLNSAAQQNGQLPLETAAVPEKNKLPEAEELKAAEVQEKQETPEKQEQTKQEQMTEKKEAGADGLANPITEYQTYDGLSQAIGFDYLSLTASTGYELEHLYAIDGTVAQLDFSDRDDREKRASVRSAKGSEDISGHYGVRYQKQVIEGMQVYVGESGEDRIAWWTCSGFTYSAQANGVDIKTFQALLETLVFQSLEE